MADVTVNITGPSTHAPSVLKPRITTPCARPSVAADVAEMFLSRGNFRQRDSQMFTEVTHVVVSLSKNCIQLLLPYKVSNVWI